MMPKHRDPRRGPTPADDVPSQKPPGVESKLKPQADHGEQSYSGSEKLRGLAAIVTGGDSGIGRAVAIAFAREGADVAIGFQSEEEDEDARETRHWVETAGRRCIAARFDVSDPDACHGFVDRVREELGRIDILVNNAAYQRERQGLHEISREQLERTFHTNIFGYIYMAQAVLPHLDAGSVILNTGSVTAFDGHAGLIDYASTKAAIHTFTKSLAKSLIHRAIRVNCVAPGPVWTPLIPSTLERDHVEQFGDDTAWGRPAQPAEIAPSFVFFASTDGRYYTGEILAPTGKATTR